MGIFINHVLQMDISIKILYMYFRWAIHKSCTSDGHFHKQFYTCTSDGYIHKSCTSDGHFHKSCTSDGLFINHVLQMGIFINHVLQMVS